MIRIVISLDTFNNCSLCPGRILGSQNSPIYFGGNLKSKIVILGANPGREEIEQHCPFVGPAGSLMRHFLDYAARRYEDDRWYSKNVCFFNAASCQFRDGKKNKIASRKEVTNCSTLCSAIYELLDYKVMLVAGNVALLKFFEDPKIGILKEKCYQVDITDRFIVPIFHPSYVMRLKNTENYTPAKLSVGKCLDLANNILRDKEFKINGTVSWRK